MGRFRASVCVESGFRLSGVRLSLFIVSTSLLVRSKAALQARFAALAICLLPLAGALAAEKYDLVGQPAPDLVARGLSGENVRVSEHRGEVVVVSFWSGSCNTCRHSFWRSTASRRPIPAPGWSCSPSISTTTWRAPRSSRAPRT
jgi:hypothetical protein